MVNRLFGSQEASPEVVEWLRESGAKVVVCGPRIKVYGRTGCGSGKTLAEAVENAQANAALNPTACLRCSARCPVYGLTRSNN